MYIIKNEKCLLKVNVNVATKLVVDKYLLYPMMMFLSVAMLCEATSYIMFRLSPHTNNDGYGISKRKKYPACIYPFCICKTVVRGSIIIAYIHGLCHCHGMYTLQFMTLLMVLTSFGNHLEREKKCNWHNNH